MVSEATIEAYKAMTKDSECPSMEAQIRENLYRTCDKFAGNEDKFERCLSYLEECASEILEGKNGDVPDEVCFRICRDYFNDEIWKVEDEEAAQAKAEAEERARRAEEKKKAKAEKGKKAKKAKAEKTKPEASAPEAAKPVEPAPEKAEPEKKPMETENSAPAQAAKIQPEPGQLDFFALMGA